MAASFKVKPNFKYSWCDTDMTESFGYVWNIKNFSDLKETTGQCIESDNFVSIENDHRHRFRLKLYPNGFDVEYAEYVFVLLKMTNVPSVKEFLEVTVEHAFSICNNKKEKTFILKGLKTLHKDALPWEYKDFIRREYLMDESKGLMQNNELILCCNIVISTKDTLCDWRYNQICIRHSGRRIIEDLRRLHENHHLSDVVLVTENEELHAHKVILAARSQVFAAMFEHNMKENQHNRVVISDITHNVFKELLRFIYTGTLPVLDEKMTVDLLVAADKYALDDLKSMCEQALAINMSAKNVSDLTILANLHNAHYLKAKIIEFMEEYAPGDAIYGLWKDIITQHPQLVAKAFQDYE